MAQRHEWSSYHDDAPVHDAPGEAFVQRGLLLNKMQPKVLHNVRSSSGQRIATDDEQFCVNLPNSDFLRSGLLFHIITRHVRNV